MMGRFKMPSDAEAGLRLCVSPSFAAPFVMRTWGKGRKGWFTATCRNSPPLADLLIPHQRLRKGEWKSILNHAAQAHLWDLPESLPPAAEFIIEDGSSVILEVQDPLRYHRVARHGVLEPGLARTVNLILRASTAFEEVLAGAVPLYFQQVEPLPRLRIQAKPGVEPDCGSCG